MLGRVHRTNPTTAEPRACQKVRRGIPNRDDGWSAIAILDNFPNIPLEVLDTWPTLFMTHARLSWFLDLPTTASMTGCFEHCMIGCTKSPCGALRARACGIKCTGHRVPGSVALAVQRNAWDAAVTGHDQRR